MSPAVTLGLTLLGSSLLLAGWQARRPERRPRAAGYRTRRPAAPPAAWFAIVVATAIGAAVGALLVGPAALAAGGIVGAGFGLVRVRARAARAAAAHSSALLRDLPDVLELLAAVAEGAAPLPRALRSVAAYASEPLGGTLRRALDAADAPSGPTLAAALRVQDPAMRPFAALVAQSDQLGTPLAPSLRALGRDERERRRGDARLRAAAAAPKLMLVVAVVLAPAALLLIVGSEVLTLVDTLRGSGR